MKGTTILFIIHLLVRPLYAQVISSEVKSFFEEVETLGEPISICKDEVSQTVDIEQMHKTVELNVNELRREVFEGIELSVLTREEAEKMFERMSQLDYIPMKYLDNGCYSRAHELTLIAKENGIELGKAFLLPKNENQRLSPQSKEKRELLPKEFSGWFYHTAALVLIEEDAQVTPHVLDLGFSPKPQSFASWKEDLFKNIDEVEISVKDRATIFHDSGYKNATKSTLSALKETQELIDQIGFGEYLYRLQSGWL